LFYGKTAGPGDRCWPGPHQLGVTWVFFFTLPESLKMPFNCTHEKLWGALVPPRDLGPRDLMENQKKGPPYLVPLLLWAKNDGPLFFFRPTTRKICFIFRTRKNRGTVVGGGGARSPVPKSSPPPLIHLSMEKFQARKRGG